MTVWLEGVLKSRVSLCSAELTVSLPHLAVQMLRNNITPENLQALKTEIVLMEKLRHPNIVQLIGTSFNTISNICMVLEWVERGKCARARACLRLRQCG